MINTKEFERQLEAAVTFRGHLCLGQVIGVRLAMLGLRLVNITDPLGEDRKKMIVFVEIDRCATGKTYYLPETANEDDAIYASIL
jgi:formylmethanofuran dehydrogenase subunit E